MKYQLHKANLNMLKQLELVDSFMHVQQSIYDRFFYIVETQCDINIQWRTTLKSRMDV